MAHKCCILYMGLHGASSDTTAVNRISYVHMQKYKYKYKCVVCVRVLTQNVIIPFLHTALCVECDCHSLCHCGLTVVSLSLTVSCVV